jgi:hypothetical protein
VYISDLDPEVLRVLTQRKVVDYLRRRRAAALLRGEYVLEVIEGKSAEVVTPDRPDGVRLDLPPRSTLWGRLEFNLYVAPQPDRPRRVAVAGRAGVAIVDDLCELEEFEGAPWDTDQVSGQIIFEALAQTAGRRAILRDREAFPVFLDAVKGIQPLVNSSTTLEGLPLAEASLPCPIAGMATDPHTPLDRTRQQAPTRCGGDDTISTGTEGAQV